MTSLPSTLTKESISTYFEAQGENIDVQSVEVLENESAIVLLVNITEEGTYVNQQEIKKGIIKELAQSLLIL